MRLVVICALLAGCGFEGRTPDPLLDAAVLIADPDGAASTMTATSFLEQLITIECGIAFSCRQQWPSSANRSFAQEWGSDLNDCLVTDPDYRQRMQIETAITNGTITFDPALAATCLAAPGIPSACSTLFSDNYDWADACYGALLGHVADGGACITDWQCALGSMCNSAVCRN